MFVLSVTACPIRGLTGLAVTETCNGEVCPCAKVIGKENWTEANATKRRIIATDAERFIPVFGL